MNSSLPLTFSITRVTIGKIGPQRVHVHMLCMFIRLFYLGNFRQFYTMTHSQLGVYFTAIGMPESSKWSDFCT